MNDKEIYNLLDDLLMSYQIVANDEDKMRLTRYYKTLNDFIIEYKTLQSNWNSLREWLLKEIINTKQKWGNKLTDKGYLDIAMTVRSYEIILDKMNELEGVENESNRYTKR